MDGSLLQTVGLAFGRKTAFEREGAIRTYSRKLFVISEEELRLLALEKERNRRFGGLWRERIYSAREDHGTAADHSYVAGGIDLSAMLTAVGMTCDEADGRLLFAAQNYKAVVEHPMTGRYYFRSDGCAEARTPLLALESARIGEGRTPCSPTNGVHPRLFFGQRTKDDANQCSFVRDICCVQPEDMPPALDIYYGERLWASPSLASLAAMPSEMRRVNVGGATYLCCGVDLGALLAKYGVPDKAGAVVKYGASCRRLINSGVRRGEFLLAWYSVREDDGLQVQNSTDLKLYSEGHVFDDITAVQCFVAGEHPAILPCKTPRISEEELLASTFYCSVESGGKRLTYYFSPEELRSLYPMREMEYPYNDHQIKKKVQCRGVLISDIVDSLCTDDGSRLELPGALRVQYLEEDGYHANTPTYIDSLPEVRGYKRPMFVLEKKELFAFPDAYHKDEEFFRVPEEPCAYRAADSANESAVKGLMGIAVRDEATLLQLSDCMIRMYDSYNGCLIAEKGVKGALKAIPAVIPAPPLERYIALKPFSAVVTVGEESCVSFRYREKPFLNVVDRNGKELTVYAGRLSGKETIPNTRENVAELIVSGDAAVLVGRDGDCPEPKRRLYIDERVFAGGTAPYGYQRYLLYRYEGWRLREAVGRFGITGRRFAAVRADGLSVKIKDPDDCFIAFRRTESKGVPYNTAEYKRKTKEFRHAQLVSIYDGHIICDDVVKLFTEM